MIHFTGTYTDQYELTMGQGYFLAGQKDKKAVFDYFFRKIPFDGGYVVFAGLQDLLDILENLRFDEDEILFLKEQGLDSGFIEYLEGFSFNGEVYSVKEGDLVFSTMPVVRVEANIIEAQIVETLLLNILNYQSLIATKARRMREVAPEGKLIDFGMRRAQGTGSYHAARAAFIGGFDATSNTRAGKDFGIPVSGTMAHSFVQSYDDELEAFRAFARARPDDCVLLVDTYDTLKSGLPNAIKVAREMEKDGKKLKGIRLDSGDLAYLAKRSRKMLDEAGLGHVKIAASNQLNEYVIKSLMEQQAPIDVFGVGTNLVIGEPDAALDGVYKLSWFDGQPRLKLSESLGKITLPDRKQVYRFYNGEGNFRGADAVTLLDEDKIECMHHPFEPHKSMSLKRLEKEALLHRVMKNGKIEGTSFSLQDIAKYSAKRLSLLPPEYKRFDNPHEYKVGISEGLKQKREQLIEQYKTNGL